MLNNHTMKIPFISVIVTAYKRKEFLLEALDSVVEQTLQRDMYEIICIKNFKDPKIDGYIRDNNIVSIIGEDKPVGEYIYLAAKKASGEVLVFLDDDDVFSKKKLERINLIFSKYSVGFYHNSHLEGEKFNREQTDLQEDNFKIIKYPYRQGLKYFRISTMNMSSIALKRDILFQHIDELKKVITSQDSFMLIISLIQKQDIFIDSGKYTFYRLHNNNVSYSKSLEKHLKFNKEVELPALFYQLELAKNYKSKAAKLFSKNLIFMVKSAVAIEENNKKEVMSAFRYLPLNVLDKKLFKRVILSILFILGSKYPYRILTRNFSR